MPWKNGGGTTRELLSWPPGVADWHWRISVAQVETEGPFSRFDGVQRWFAVLDGEGVELALGQGPELGKAQSLLLMERSRSIAD